VNFIKDLLTFFSENKEITIGGITVLTEIVVIVVNAIRRCRADKRVHISSVNKQSKLKLFLWSANPLNLFQKID
jgi:hypothetical protein